MNNNDTNLNNTYYQTLEENFNHAIELFEKDLPQDLLLNLLKNGNILQKQIAALKINMVENAEQAQILYSNLTGQDGKIREAVSLKLTELIPEYFQYFQTHDFYNTLLDAIIDVNPNVCRNIMDVIKFFKTKPDFIEYFAQKLFAKTQKLIDLVKTFDFQDGKYKVNKEVFKLYWCLETLYEIADYISLESLKQILLQTKDINEYTIREKTAKILSKDFDDEICKQIQSALKCDKNYYVRRF